MDEFVQKIAETIRLFQMIAPGEGVVAGVSGGADSVCLLLVLSQLRERIPCSVTAVHVEHGLRGKEALEDAAFTQELCRRIQVPCRVVHVDAALEARRRKMSLEEAGRALRYEAFARVKEESRAAKIATAHHAQDQAETVLLNLARGTGLLGMGGIRPVGGDRIRPLLLTDREQIEAWLKRQGQSWRTDQTNREDAYARNRIRHQVIPVLTDQINQEAVRHFGQAALEAQRAQDYLIRQARQVMEKAVRWENGTCRISAGMLGDQEEIIQEQILRLSVSAVRDGLGMKDIGREHIDRLKALAGMNCGRMIQLPGGLRGVREKDVLCLYTEGEAPSADRRDRDEPLAGDCRIQMGGESFSFRYLSPAEVPEPIPEKRYTKWLAYDTMGPDLRLRTRRGGDYLVVNREGGRKKLKDYLIDQKIPRRERDSVLLVAQGSHILWVVGGRISEAAKVSGQTERVLMVCREGARTEPGMSGA